MRRILAVAFIAALAVSAVGCSKSKSSSRFDPAASEAAALAGDQDLANGDFVAADGHYREALGLDGGNGHANLGAAITGLALLQNDPGVDSLLTFLGDVPPIAPAARAALPHRVLARLGLSPRLSYDPLSNGRGLAKLLLRSAEDPIMASWYQRLVRNRIMPRLQYVEDRMNAIEVHPDFVYMIPTEVSGASIPLEVDLGEVLAIDALANSLQGVLGMLLAYNFDALPDATDMDLLDPTGHFGDLNTDGAAVLAAARANLLLAVTKMDAMDAFIRAEDVGDDQSDDVIPVDVLDTPEFLELLDGYHQANTALTSTVSVDVDSYDGLSVIPVDVDLGLFFTDPITDWKDLVPDHSFDLLTEEIVLDEPISFPDPTFNGIFPGMDDATWQDIIGPVARPLAIR